MDGKAIDSLFRVVAQISDRERENNKNKASNPSNRLINRLFLELVMFPFGLAILMALARKFFGVGEWVVKPGLAMLVVSYVGIFLHPVLSLIINRKSVARGVSNPFYLLMDNAKDCSRVDAGVLRYLENKSAKNLKFLLLEVDSERAAFKRRISLIVGAIERIGLIPGVLAIFVILEKLDDGQPEWVYAIAYAAPALYILGVAMHYLVTRMERIAALIEYVIEEKEKAEAN